jgi:hypothetical protein
MNVSDPSSAIHLLEEEREKKTLDRGKEKQGQTSSSHENRTAGSRSNPRSNERENRKQFGFGLKLPTDGVSFEKAPN